MTLWGALRIALLLLGCVISIAIGLFTILLPEYTDDEIRRSIVDTWEPSAFVTYLLLCVLAFFGALALVVGIFSKGSTERILVAAAVLLTLGAATLEYRSHKVLTDRTTAITGEEFGP
jgi:hypothetical protein